MWTWPFAGTHRALYGPAAATLMARVGRDQGFGGQASKGIRWMPWHQEAMKDVAKLR
jgi:hypothetical protein